MTVHASATRARQGYSFLSKALHFTSFDPKLQDCLQDFFQGLVHWSIQHHV